LWNDPDRIGSPATSHRKNKLAIGGGPEFAQPSRTLVPQRRRGISDDMRTLLASSGPHAADAVSLFVYRIGSWDETTERLRNQ